MVRIVSLGVHDDVFEGFGVVPGLAEVLLVGNKSNLHVLIRVLSDFIQPLPQIFERVQVSHVINQEGTNCKPIVSRSYAKKLPCPRSIPQLSSNRLVAVGQRRQLGSELDAVGCLGFFLEGPLANSEHKIGLSNLLIANHDEFVKVVEVFVWVLKYLALVGLQTPTDVS